MPVSDAACRAAFLNAWQDWSDAAAVLSASKRRPSSFTLQREQARLEGAACVYAQRLGVSVSVLLAALADGGRAGCDIDVSLRALEDQPGGGETPRGLTWHRLPHGGSSFPISIRPFSISVQ